MIDLINPVELYGTITQKVPQIGFFRSFFRDSTEFHHTTENFLVDFVAESDGVALYVDRDGDYEQVPEKGYETAQYKPGYTKEKKVLTAKMLTKRDAGDSNILGKQTPGNKKAKMIGKQQAELRDRLKRLEEEQCSEALLTGVVTIKGKGLDHVVDFGLPASHKITPAILWSSAATAVPLNDLEDGITIMGDDGADTDVINIFGINAWRNFENTTQVKEQLDNRRIEKGVIAPRKVIPKGAQYRGTFAGIGEIWTYTRKYTNRLNASKNFMDTDKYIQISKSAVLEAHYGPIFSFKAPNNLWATDVLPQALELDDETIENRQQSAPLMAALDTTAWIVGSPV